MKNHLHKLACCALALIAAAGFTFTRAEAADTWDKENAQKTASRTEISKGSWYNLKGERILQIDDHTVNGNPIVQISKTVYMPDHFEITVAEKTGNRTLTIGDDYIHSGCITYNNTVLRKDNKPHYFESVDGIANTMTMDEVKARWGEPDSEVKDSDNPMLTWNYTKKGTSVIFAPGGLVTRVILQKGSPLRFDRSKLNCENPVEAFRKAYGLSAIRMNQEGKLAKHLFYVLTDVSGKETPYEGIVFEGTKNQLEKITLLIVK
ncbi:MAG: hypothetical protein LKE33_12030 [Acidaminococcus sp.]|jgi:hypothetical protein|nr:hypothetical protein [Acidaminococcus sp.]MCI2099606.1 hypothetical protein [Acidaminococcus sp.]MCI2113691.1 hypothetical protein [Acidaminococcus sp.]MCI2115774.1 hypothetical protein [Acidaminococcus sp.]